MPVSELLARISSHELTEWEVFFKMHPFGHERFDLGFGIVAAVISNVFRGKNRKRYEPKDFMPRFGSADSSAVQSQDDMLATVEKLNKAMGGVDMRGSG